MKNIFSTTIISFVLLAGASNAQEHGLAIIDGGKLESGYLWTATFQRVDGQTCAWIEVIEQQITRLIYDDTVKGCRSVPPPNATAIYDYSGKEGDRMTFNGADFDIVKNSASQVSGSWNHVSYNSAFDVDNVVFRALPVK